MRVIFTDGECDFKCIGVCLVEIFLGVRVILAEGDTNSKCIAGVRKSESHSGDCVNVSLKICVGVKTSETSKFSVENVFIGLKVDSVNGEVTFKDIDVFFFIDVDEATGTCGMDVKWMALGEDDRFT